MVDGATHRSIWTTQIGVDRLLKVKKIKIKRGHKVGGGSGRSQGEHNQNSLHEILKGLIKIF